MNEEAIIHRYAEIDNPTAQMRLSDDSLVIGQEIDTENHLYYVVKNGANYSVVYAGDVLVAENLVKRQPKFVTYSTTESIDNSLKKP